MPVDPNNKRDDPHAGTDEQLVARVCAGDSDAFDALYVRYRPRIMQVAKRFVRQRSDAEDIVQDTFMKAFIALPRFRGQCQFYSWLHQIAHNTGINYWRRLRIPTAEVTEIETEIGPEETTIARQNLEVAEAAIESLAGPLRQALLLNTVHGFEYAEVSILQKCPLGTVRSRISRARTSVAAATASA